MEEEQPQTEKGDVAVPSAAAVADDDDPPLELLEATPPPAAASVAAPEPVVAPEPVLEASPAPAPQPAAAPSRPPVVATRPQVTPARPAATLEEEVSEHQDWPCYQFFKLLLQDDEEDDDFDETLSERLIGLTEMFPQVKLFAVCRIIDIEECNIDSFFALVYEDWQCKASFWIVVVV